LARTEGFSSVVECRPKRCCWFLTKLHCPCPYNQTVRLLLLAVLLGEIAVAAPALRFEPNVGQTNRRAQFIARSSRYNIFLTTAGAVLAPRNSAEGVRIQFVDSSPAKLEGTSPLPGVVNYFRGSAPGLADIPTYARVVQHNIYAGIDAVFHGEEGQLEYDFVVAPGADPARIILAFDGARSVRIDDRGEIELLTDAGTLTQRRPILYQERDGQRVPVDGLRFGTRVLDRFLDCC